MRLSELLIDITNKTFSGVDPEIYSVAKDAEKITPGALYVCIRGISGDGHTRIDEAISRGAAAVICDNAARGLPFGVPAVLVGNSRYALGFICRRLYGDPLNGIKLVGVTGTNGKTSSTYFLESVYRTAGIKCGVIGTAGVRIDGEPMDFKYATSTTPDTIELFEIFRSLKKAGVTHIAMEATSHALALEKLGALRFDHAIFTNLTRDHLDFHHSLEEYFTAKLKLFALADAAILNFDDPASEKLIDVSPKTFGYSVRKQSDFRAENIKYAAEGSFFTVKLENVVKDFFLHIPGDFSVYNALGAIASAYLMGIDPETIAEGLRRVACIPGRIQPIANDKGIGVIVDYAHSPDGLEKIIKAVRSFTPGKVITVFGCGGDRDRAKRPMMGKIAGELSDFCVVTSDNPRSEVPENIIDDILPGLMETGCEYMNQPDRKKAIFQAIALAKSGDSVILAGKGHESYQEYENKRRIDFDDRLVAKEALEVKDMSE